MQQHIDKLIPSDKGQVSILLMSISICLGAFVFSYNTVCLTQIAHMWKLKDDLSKEDLVYQLSIATSCLNFGTFVSPILYKKYVGALGEIKGLLLIDIVTIIATVCQLISLEFYMLSISRFVIGFAMGLSTAIIPVYLSSIAPPSMLGKLGAFNQVLITMGPVLAYLAGYMLNDDPHDQIRWRIFMGIPLLALIVRIIGLQLKYRFQTLQRHINRKEMNKIQQYSMMTYGSCSEQIVNSIVQLKQIKKQQVANSSTFGRRLVIALVVIASNQINGINSILYYAKQLFNKVTHDDQQYSQILIVLLSLMQVLATLISTQVIDKFGRKLFIIRGQFIVAVLLLLIFVFDKFIQPHFEDFGTVGVIILIFAHILVHNLTLGPCCIIYCTQIIEDITWVIITLKGLALLIALTSQYMIEYIGLGFMFLIFFCLTSIAHIFLRPRLKQTKGLSRAQIFQSFENTKRDSIKTQNTETQNLIS